MHSNWLQAVRYSECLWGWRLALFHVCMWLCSSDTLGRQARFASICYLLRDLAGDVLLQIDE